MVDQATEATIILHYAATALRLRHIARSMLRVLQDVTEGRRRLQAGMPYWINREEEEGSLSPHGARICRSAIAEWRENCNQLAVAVDASRQHLLAASRHRRGWLVEEDIRYGEMAYMKNHKAYRYMLSQEICRVIYYVCGYNCRRRCQTQWQVVPPPFFPLPQSALSPCRATCYATVTPETEEYRICH